MDYNSIFSCMKKNLSEVMSNIDIESIEPSQSLQDIGADSLEQVETLSRMMKELKIKIPRMEIAKAKNIDDIINLFVQYTNSLPN